MPDDAAAEIIDDLMQDGATGDDVPEDSPERRSEQLKYYGGDELDDDEDLSALDRGDSVLPDEDNEEGADRGDKAEEKAEDDDAEDEGDETGDEEEEADTDADDEADSEEDADSDDSRDESDGDEADDDDGEDDDSGESENTSSNNQRVPLSRFNEVNERMKAAERRLEQLEKVDTAEEEATEEQFDFDGAEKEYMDLLLDGKTDQAAQKRQEIRAAEKADYLASAQQTSQQTVDSNAAVRELNSLTSQAQNMYPVFDETHSDYDPNVSGKTVVYMKGYISDGMDPADAFVAALADTIDLFDLDTKYGATESQDEEKPKEKVVKKKGKISKKKEKADVQGKQHKSPAGEGRASADQGAVVPDISGMTDEEIDALPPETLARIRGDYVD